VKLIRSEVVVPRINLILSFNADARPDFKIFHKDDAYYKKFHSEKHILMNGYCIIDAFGLFVEKSSC